MWLKLAVTTFYIYKGKLRNNFSNFPKKYFSGIDRTTYDICYFIKTRVEFQIAGIAERYLNRFSSYSFAL